MILSKVSVGVFDSSIHSLIAFNFWVTRNPYENNKDVVV